MTLAAEQTGTGSTLHSWIVAHDDSRLFVGLYISLALVLSIAIGLFWLLALLVVHLSFEWVRSQAEGFRGLDAIGRSFWSVRLDLALFLFALVLALHLQLVFGVLGLHLAGRAGMAAQAGLRGARFAAWEKVIRGVLLSADDAVQGARGLRAIRKARAKSAGTEGPLATEEVRAARPDHVPSEGLAGVEPARHAASGWSVGDYVTVSLAVVCMLLILVAPWLGHESWDAVVSLLSAELRPFPVR